MPVVARFQQAVRRILPAVVVATVAMGTIGCGGDSPTGVKPNPPGGSFAVEGVLVPGASVRLTGVSGAPSVAIDGQSVAVVPDGAGAVRLTVPVLAACEADGRLVTIAVTEGGATRTLKAPLSVPEGRTLGVGESRILSPEELACIQLPRGNARYALTMVDFRRDTTFRELLRLSIRGDAGAASAHRVAMAGPSALLGPGATDTEAHLRQVLEAFPVSARTGNAAALAAAVGRVQVDPRLATAGAGDLVQLPVPSNGTGAPLRNCLADPSTIPLVTYEVVASSGQVVVLAAADDPRVATLRSGGHQTSLTEAARLVDQYALRALRRLIGSEVEWHTTAGGRIVIALTPLKQRGIAGLTYGRDAGSRLQCANGAEINAVQVDIETVLERADARWVAGVAVHEFAHTFDLGGVRKSTQGQPGGTRIWGEALAENATELFARMIAGGGDAPQEAMTAGHGSGLYLTWLQLWVPSRELEGRSPFVGLAQYSAGARLFLAAREAAGDATVAPGDAPAPGSTLYERLVGRTGLLSASQQMSAVDSMAAELGMSGDDFLDQAWLAIATDDEVGPNAARAHGLPQIASWDNSGFIERAALSRPEILVAPGAGRDESVSTAGGAAVTRYLETSAARGAAAVVKPTGTTPMRVRLTRLR